MHLRRSSWMPYRVHDGRGVRTTGLDELLDLGLFSRSLRCCTWHCARRIPCKRVHPADGTLTLLEEEATGDDDTDEDDDTEEDVDAAEDELTEEPEDFGGRRPSLRSSSWWRSTRHFAFSRPYMREQETGAVCANAETDVPSRTSAAAMERGVRVFIGEREGIGNQSGSSARETSAAVGAAVVLLVHGLRRRPVGGVGRTGG